MGISPDGKVVLRRADKASPTRARNLTIVATDFMEHCHVGNHGVIVARPLVRKASNVNTEFNTP